MKTKDYVEFKQSDSPHNYPPQEISSRTPDEALRLLPEGCIAFRFLSRRVMRHNEKEIPAGRFNTSGWYYLGKELSLQEAKKQVSEKEWNEIYRSGCPKVVIVSSGKAFPLWAIDQVLSVN